MATRRLEQYNVFYVFNTQTGEYRELDEDEIVVRLPSRRRKNPLPHLQYMADLWPHDQLVERVAEAMTREQEGKVVGDHVVTPEIVQEALDLAGLRLTNDPFSGANNERLSRVAYDGGDRFNFAGQTISYALDAAGLTLVPARA